MLGAVRRRSSSRSMPCRRPAPPRRPRRRPLSRRRSGPRRRSRPRGSGGGAATTSCTSRTTRCGTAPSTSTGSPGWARPVRRPVVVVAARDRALPARPRARRSITSLTVGASGLDRELRTSASRRHARGRCRGADPGRRRRRHRRRQRLGGGRPARRGRRRARPRTSTTCRLTRRGRLRPGRRPVHRHEPRSGLPDGARPFDPAPARSSRRSRRRAGVTGDLDRQARAATLLEEAARAVGGEARPTA